jgi:hypothetical protein
VQKVAFGGFGVKGGEELIVVAFVVFEGDEELLNGLVGQFYAHTIIGSDLFAESAFNNLDSETMQ